MVNKLSLNYWSREELVTWLDKHENSFPRCIGLLIEAVHFIFNF